MVAMPTVLAQLIENPALTALARPLIKDWDRPRHGSALGQRQPHHLGLRAHFNEATNTSYARTSDESTRWDATAAEVGAALNVSARRASSQMYLARSLRERLPKVNAVFLAGGIGARLVAMISWRTHLVLDEAAMAAIDAGIAEAAGKWGGAFGCGGGGRY